MKELDGLGDPVLNEHSLGIASHQGGSADFEVVGEEDGRFFVPQFDDAQLAQWALIALQVDTLVQDFRGAKGSSQGMQGNPAPGGSRSAPDLSQHFFRATAQGDKKDALLVEAVEIGVGGQLRVEDQFGRGLAGALAPKVHEAQNFTDSIGLGDARVGIAKHPLGRVSSQKDQDSLLTSAARGKVVLFQGFLLGIGGDGVKVQIDGRAAGQAGPLDLLKPGLHQSQVDSSVDPGTVSGQIGAFGSDIETCKQSDPFVKDQVHDMTLAFFPQQLEGQKCAQSLLGRNFLGAGKIGLAPDGGQIDVSHEGDEKKQTAHPGPKGPGCQIDLLDIGDGSCFRLDGERPFLIPTSRQPGKAFLAQENRQSVDANRVPGDGQLPLDIVDGKVLLAHGHRQFSDPIPCGRPLGPAPDPLEESEALRRVVSELVTEDPKGPGGIIKADRHLVGRQPPHEETAQGFVLTLQRRFGREEELSLGGFC